MVGEVMQNKDLWREIRLLKFLSISLLYFSFKKVYGGYDHNSEHIKELIS